MYRIVFLLLSSLFLESCVSKSAPKIGLPYFNESDFTPLFISNAAEVKEKITHTIADFSFLNEDSCQITQKNIEGKIHITNFIFTSCGSICPVMTQNLKIVSDEFKNDTNVVLLSFSVTPWIDQPSVLKAYKSRNGIKNTNWHFMTGTKGDIYKIARTSYFAEEEIGFSKDSAEFLHTEHFMLVDKTKRIRGVYNGTLQLEMLNLIDDIKKLKEEN